MSQPVVDAKPVPGLQEVWPQIQSVRAELATELEQMAGDFPGSAGVRLRWVARWFRGPAEFDSAIGQPDLIAVGLPFLEFCSQFARFNPAEKPAAGNPQPASAGGPDTPLTSLQISHAARQGASSLVSRPALGNSRHWQILLYPVTVTIGAWLVWVAFAFWVAPQFEEMFAEFGIELATITSATLGMSRFVREWWLIMVALPIACGVALWLFQRFSSGGQSQSSGLVSRILASRRESIAVWAWHLSMLLESGVAEKRAVITAGDASKNAWLRRMSQAWSSHACSPASDNRFSTATGEPPLFCHIPKFQLVNPVMALPASAAKIAMLRELSLYYRDRGAGNGTWWIQWLSLLLKFFLVVMIFLVVISLFSPLLSLIGGLSKAN